LAFGSTAARNCKKGRRPGRTQAEDFFPPYYYESSRHFRLNEYVNVVCPLLTVTKVRIGPHPKSNAVTVDHGPWPPPPPPPTIYNTMEPFQQHPGHENTPNDSHSSVI
jgi:hypothetical protein